MARQKLRYCSSQRAFAVAVDDPHAFSPSHNCFVQELVDAIGGLINVCAYDVDLGCEMGIDTYISADSAR